MEQTEREMTMNEYQSLALETAVYPQPIIYPTLGFDWRGRRSFRQNKEGIARQQLTIYG